MLSKGQFVLLLRYIFELVILRDLFFSGQTIIPVVHFFHLLRFVFISRRPSANIFTLSSEKFSRSLENSFHIYTCDKQVLWESVGAFFPGDNSLVSSGKSHSSRVRGLVVRCLLFNPEVSCSNPCVCANFFTSIPKQKVLTFFGTMRPPFFGFETFFRKFFNVPKVSSLQFV